MDKMGRHLALLCSACETIKNVMELDDWEPLRELDDLEREGDIIRREIVAAIYEGAFLPVLRPSLCTFVETVDQCLNMVRDLAHELMDLKGGGLTRCGCFAESLQAAQFNHKMCEMLSLALGSVSKGEDLREKSLAIRIYEKKIDEIKFDLQKKMQAVEVKNFWEGKLLSDFVYHLTAISDLIEDASDYLQIMNVSLR